MTQERRCPVRILKPLGEMGRIPQGHFEEDYSHVLRSLSTFSVLKDVRGDAVISFILFCT